MKNRRNIITGPIMKLTVCIILGLLSGNASAITDAMKIKIARGSYSDETVIRFLAAATADFDGSYDSWKLFSSNVSVPNIFTKVPSGDVAINALPSFTASVTMDVFLKIGTAGTYSFTPTEIGAFASGVQVVMKDLSTGQLYNLRTPGTFTVSLPVITQTAAARFQVFFSYPAATQVANATCDTCSDGTVAVTKAGETTWNYLVKDTEGNNVTSGVATAPTYSINGLASGDYTVSISGSFSCTENRLVSVSIAPVTLGATFLDFAARAEAGAVELAWSTGMESNTDYFTVESSSDGINFEAITSVPAAGNSSGIRNYSASDENPNAVDGYYRIKLTDLNGEISYSSVARTVGSELASVSVFPVPASERLTVCVEGTKNSSVLMVISDLAGREIFRHKVFLTSDRENIPVVLPAMMLPGIYVLSAAGSKTIMNQQIVIK